MIILKISVFFIRRFSNDITEHTENEKSHQFRNQKDIPFAERTIALSDIQIIGIKDDKEENGRSQQNERVMLKSGNEIQARKRNQHPRNTATRALEARDQMKRAGNPDFRYRRENEIENPCTQNDQVFFQNPKKTFSHGNYC